MVCKQCRQTLPAASRFCHSCGVGITPIDSPRSRVGPSSRSTAATVGWIAGRVFRSVKEGGSEARFGAVLVLAFIVAAIWRFASLLPIGPMLVCVRSIIRCTRTSATRILKQ